VNRGNGVPPLKPRYEVQDVGLPTLTEETRAVPSAINGSANVCSARPKGLLLWHDSAHVAEPGSADDSRPYGRALVRLRRIGTEVRVQIRCPREEAFDGAAPEFAVDLPGTVKSLLVRPPSEVRLRKRPASSLASTRLFPVAAQ
jgi:hypothetical protein